MVNQVMNAIMTIAFVQVSTTVVPVTAYPTVEFHKVVIEDVVIGMTATVIEI
jgi:hypothetical protein